MSLGEHKWERRYWKIGEAMFVLVLWLGQPQARTRE